ncbi:cytochrome c biogenesis protein CcsA [Paludibacter jiangxiensis]|nr:cytochrome c biogenesis protein CcsA [Paludibacter jiangxiensis]
MDLCYHNWWFVALWVLLAVVVVISFIRIGKAPFPVWLFHSAIVFILAGALTTFIFGEKGTIHLRQGLPARFFLDNTSSDCYSLPFALVLNRFEIKYHEGTTRHKDYVSSVTVVDRNDKAQEIVSMNNVLSYKGYRFLQGSYDGDNQGVVLLVSHDPWGMWLVYFGYLLFSGGIVLSLFRRRGKIKQGLANLKPNRQVLFPFLGALIFAGVIVPSYVLLRMSHSEKYLQPVLQSFWLKPHVWCIAISYALFVLVALNSLMACVLRMKKSWLEIEHLRVTAKLMLYPAIVFLGIGICLGSVWANESWGAYWSWDPKEVWALITFVIYAVPLHDEKIKWLQNPLSFHLYLIFALISVVMTYFGVNGFLGGMHSYAG